jgi:hypothetical protein
VLVLIPLVTGWVANRLHRSDSRRVRSAS